MSHHHHPGHHFDPEFMRASEEWRRQVFPPEAALGDLLPADDLILADIGAGTGYYALAAARRLGRGRVYAIDRQADMLAVIDTRAAAEGLQNITLVEAPAHALPLGDDAADAVLMANVFHDIEEKSEALAEVRRILRPHGCFCLVEWTVEPTDMGPPAHIRIGPDELKAALTQAGFVVKGTKAGPGPFYTVAAGTS